MTEDSGSHLRTKYVFIDTQAFRREGFDWSGKTLSTFTELAEQGQVCLLVTDVMLGEVKSQLRELLNNARTSLTRHAVVLKQLGASQSLEVVQNEASAVIALEDSLERFLKRTSAIHVPLISGVGGVLDDYFARRPPFSAKKKAEFPDAISVASLRCWCQQNSATAYVVSEDPDFQECCSESGPLYHVSTVAGIISQATVSKSVHDALAEAVRESSDFRDRLVKTIISGGVKIIDSQTRHMGAELLTARIEEVGPVEITSVNVLKQDKDEFNFDVELEVEVTLDLEVETEPGPSPYETWDRYWLQQVLKPYFYAEVVARFDMETRAIEIGSIELDPELSVSTYDIDDLY